MMEEALLSIGLMIVLAKVAEGLLRRFRVSSIVAYAGTGVILGPVLGIVEATAELEILLSIGVFLFFFLIGLDEIDVSSFMSVIRGRFFIAAAIAILVPLFAGIAVTSDFYFDFGLGLDFTDALAVAGVLALSSLGVVAKVLSDEGRLREPLGLQIFAIVIIAELIALLVVGFTIGERSHDLSVANILTLLGQMVGFTIVAWLLSTKVIPRLIVILQRVLQVPHLSFGLLLGGLFLMVVAAVKMGVHGSIGALLFGVALSNLPGRIRQDVMPGIRSTADGLFVPLFFASAGLHLSLAFTSLPPLAIAAIVIVPLVGKFLGAIIGAYVIRMGISFPLATGLMAKGAAEIALLLIMLNHHLIGKELFSLLILIMFGYFLIMPPLITFAINRVRYSGSDEVVPGIIPAPLIRFALDDMRIKDILDATPNYPDTDLTVRNFVDNWIVPHQEDYVVTHRGELAGMVSLSMLRYLPKSDWASTPLGNVLSQRMLEASPEDFLEDVLQRMKENSLTVIPVVNSETGEFMGTVTTRDILDIMMIEVRGEL